MPISPIDPIAPAWNHMVRILLKPFEIKKWFLLGFCAFLAQCGQTGGGGGGNLWKSNSTGNRFGGLDELKNWINDNFNIVVFVGLAILVTIIALILLVNWLSSRGRFMLLDGIVKNRGAVKEPWMEYKPEGNSLFLFQIAFGVCTIVAYAIVIGVPLLIALPDIRQESFGDAAVVSIIVAVVLVIPLTIFMILFTYFINTFVVPTMYKRRVGTVEAIKIAWSQLCKGHIGPAILLFLMMIVFGIGAGIFSIFAMCFTCCLVAIPYIGSVLLLPIPVFFTCYTLEYIQQFGPDWQFFKPLCPACGYDREGLDSFLPCPECGQEPTPDE